jgi:hypothetical protein
MKTLKTPQELFWNKVNKNTENGCWEWTGALDTWGYGQFTSKQKRYSSHRLSIEWAGFDPKGKIVCHKCDNPKCVNPDHLFLGTQSDNMLDMVSKKRNNNTHKKLSDDQVRDIRQSTETYEILCKTYDVSLATIWKVKKKMNYKDVE